MMPNPYSDLPLSQTERQWPRTRRELIELLLVERNFFLVEDGEVEPRFFFNTFPLELDWPPEEQITFVLGRSEDDDDETFWHAKESDFTFYNWGFVVQAIGMIGTLEYHYEA